MPCSDSTSGLNLRLDQDERLVFFQFAKITCSSEIGAGTGLNAFCVGKSLEEILNIDFYMLRTILGLEHDEEKQFIMYMELEALKAGVAQYLGVDHPV
jgi:NifU-like protein involved in Fe-S cluster formation